jgi:hypothetical protein
MRWMTLSERANGLKTNFILSYTPFRAVSRERDRSPLIDKGTYLVDK